MIKIECFFTTKFRMLLSLSNITTVPSIQLSYLATNAILGNGSDKILSNTLSSKK